MLRTAIEAARQAGQAIAKRYPTNPGVTIKGCRDLVSEADMEAQELILDLIRARFPDHAVVSEESGRRTIGKGYTWVVDPLDGTTNYVHHHPVFAVSIALLEDDAPIIGVIHDPLRGHVFVAERGKGAKLNNQSVHVSRVKGGQGQLYCRFGRYQQCAGGEGIWYSHFRYDGPFVCYEL